MSMSIPGSGSMGGEVWSPIASPVLAGSCVEKPSIYHHASQLLPLPRIPDSGSLGREPIYLPSFPSPPLPSNTSKKCQDWETLEKKCGDKKLRWKQRIAREASNCDLACKVWYSRSSFCFHLCKKMHREIEGGRGGEGRAEEEKGRRRDKRRGRKKERGREWNTGKEMWRQEKLRWIPMAVGSAATFLHVECHGRFPPFI